MFREYRCRRGGIRTKVKVGPKKPRFYYDPPFYKRWPNRAGIGKATKRAYNRSRRQANRREVTGGKIGKRIGYASECKWKGW